MRMPAKNVLIAYALLCLLFASCGKLADEVQLELQTSNFDADNSEVSSSIASNFEADSFDAALQFSSKSSSISATGAGYFNDLFTQYGPGWTGGDVGISIPLPDGSVAWVFADSFTGTVLADRSRPGASSHFINNSLVVTKIDGSFNTITGGTTSSPTSFVIPDDPDETFWPADGLVYNDKLILFLWVMEFTGTTAFGWELRRTEIAIFSLTDFSLLGKQVYSNDSRRYWGCNVLEQNDYIYVYGADNMPSGKKWLVASRIPANNPSAAPEFYKTTGWDSSPYGSEHLLDDMSNHFSLFEHAGQFYLLSQGNWLSDKVWLYNAATPLGPFSNRRKLFNTPLPGAGTWSYSAVAHPSFIKDDGSLLVGYCVNAANFYTLFTDADRYRPYFAWVQGWE